MSPRPSSKMVLINLASTFFWLLSSTLVLKLVWLASNMLGGSLLRCQRLRSRGCAWLSRITSIR